MRRLEGAQSMTRNLRQRSVMPLQGVALIDEMYQLGNWMIQAQKQGAMYRAPTICHVMGKSDVKSGLIFKTALVIGWQGATCCAPTGCCCY